MCSHAFEVVCFQIGWVVGATITQQIRRYNAVTLLSEVQDLMIPSMRSLWESMQEQEERFLGVTRRGEYISVRGAGRELHSLCQVDIGSLPHIELKVIRLWWAMMGRVRNGVDLVPARICMLASDQWLILSLLSIKRFTYLDTHSIYCEVYGVAV
jgi:hypothetical protein